MDKHEIAALFKEIAVLLELQGENPLKSAPITMGPERLKNLEEDLELLVRENDCWKYLA